ncbi:MAG: PKD domain-containing protein, partial [Ferruginibacter sp.]
YALLLDTLTIQSIAGPDRLSCQNAPVQLGTNPRATYVYSWSPVTALSDPNISNPIATPSVTTQYVVTTSHEGGGCVSTDTVIVKAAVIDNTLQIIGPIAGCFVTPTILKVAPEDSIQWYRNGVAIPGATQTQYNVVQGGSYHAMLFSFTGCSLSTIVQLITVYPAPDAGFNINTTEQCFNTNQFVFTNTSSISAGTMQYNWDLGDGTTANTTNVTHSYTAPGTYIVRLLVTSDNGCLDSINYTVKVFENPVAGFTASINELCFLNNLFVFTDTSSISSGTLQYSWDMGDGNIKTSRNVTHSYTIPGTYTVKLLVTSDMGCIDTASFDVTVNATPVAGFSVANAQQCFGNNQFNFINRSTIYSGTMLYAWDLGDGTTASTRDVTHSYATPGDYFIRLVVTSDKGCGDISTFNVKVLPYAVADFYVAPACINLRLPITNKTLNTSGTPLNFLWDFGNGQTSTQTNPVYSYPAPGNYTIKLTVNSNLCPQTLTVKQQDVLIDAPATAARYTDVIAVMNFEEQLQARQIGTSVLWAPSVSLDNPGSYRPIFKGLNEQLYTIRLKSATGCVTIDTQLVKIRKRIEIYVPTTFTPDGNGRNDYLRPVLMGFRSVNYFRVFNRWGKLLFQMQSDVPGWDGRTNGQVQEMQTVVWEIEAVDVDGKVHKKKGTSILLH